MLDECLSLPVLREFGLFDMCRKFLEFLKNTAFEWSEKYPYFVDVGKTGPIHERCQYLAGYRGYGDVFKGAGGNIERALGLSAQDTAPMYGLLIIALVHVFYDVRIDFKICMFVFYSLSRAASDFLSRAALDFSIMKSMAGHDDTALHTALHPE